MKKIVVSIIWICSAISVFSQNIEGSWSGVLDAGAAKLPVVVHIEKNENGFSATMDSPSQGAKGIPISSIRFEEPSLSFTVINLGVKYVGILENDTITGTFEQSGMKFPLNLSRSNEIPALPKRPQEPLPPYPYHAEDVEFENKEAGITLAGTFTWPKEGKNFPAVILITGSGPQNRDEEVLGHKPFLVLSDYLTRHGIAVLRYDDRGVAGSGGVYKTARLSDFATDALSAIRYLQTRKEVNSKKTGAVGHSEGGTIAYMLAGEPRNNLAFIVSMAGMSIPGDSLLRMQRYLIARQAGASEEMIAQQEQIIEIIDGIVKQHPEEYILQNMQSLIDEALPDSLKKDESVKAAFRQGLKQMMSPELQSLLCFNPSEALTGIQCPVLALGGEKDLQVPAAINLTRIKELVKSRVTIKQYPELNHLFQHSITGSVNEYATIEETISPEVLSDIARWIKQLR